MARHHYLIPYEWVTVSGDSYWRVPHGSLGAIDLRPLSAHVAGGIPEGYAFAVYDNTIIDVTATYLGDSLEGNLSGLQKTRVRNALSLPIGTTLPDKLQDVLWAILTTLADPDGIDRCQPLLPTAGNNLELHLGGYSLIKKEQCSISHPAWPNILALLRNDYRRIRTEYLAQGIIDVHLKFLDVLKVKYGVNDHRIFIPPDLPDEGVRPRGTTITESFNKVDSSTLGPDLTWTEVVADWSTISNTARTAFITSNGLARANTDLASDDHYAQIVISTLPTLRAAGTVCRKDSTITETFYFAQYDNDVGIAPFWGTFQRIDAVDTAIGTNTVLTATAGDSIKLQTDGSTITRYRNGSSQNAVTDTGITGNLRTGMRLHEESAARLDNFEAADLAVGIPEAAQRRNTLWGYEEGVYG